MGMGAITGIFGAMILLAMLVVALFMVGFCWWKVFRRAGFNPALGLLAFIPGVALVLVLFLACKRWPIYDRLPHEARPVGEDYDRTFFLIAGVAMLALFVIIGLMVVAVPKFIKLRNEARAMAAKSQAQSIAAAIERYAVGHERKYPLGESDLVLNGLTGETYNYRVVDGYKYKVDITEKGYAVTAQPQQCLGGEKMFTVITGGILEEANCPVLSSGD